MLKTGLILTVTAMAVCFYGCNGFSIKGKEEVDNFEKKVKQEIYLDQNPWSALSNVRMYALNNMMDLDDLERKAIKTEKPKMVKNPNTLEYVFYWKSPVSGEILEVVCSPPPCQPVAAFRKDRVYFP